MGMPLKAFLCVVLLVGTAACNCGAPGNGDGGHSGDGGSNDGGGIDAGPFTGTLLISPRDVTLTVISGQPLPTVQFSATGDGAPVTPAWAETPSTVGGIDSTGLFSATPNGGVATVSASYGTATDATTVTVKLQVLQNGSDGGSQDAGAGGWGGVGGEGVGGPVPQGTLTVLTGTPTADSATFLYPYDGTVWPRGLLAPLLQWTPGHPYEAVLIKLDCTTYSYAGAFAATATPFLHHPIPQAAWEQMGDLCKGQNVTVQLVFAAGGVAYGPLTETWKVAPGYLKGVVYYNSYGTRLAHNATGALGPNPNFGGATLSIRGGSTDPGLVAGGNGGNPECRVCHVVASGGSTMIVQHGDAYSATSAYALRSGNAETPMTPTDGRFAWGGLSPDGTTLFSNAAPLPGSSATPSALFQVPAGTAVASTGIPTGLRAGMPVFSANGRQVAFNWYAGAVDGGTGDQRTLATMDFTAPGTFSNFTPIYRPTGTLKALYPTYLPTGTGVVFQEETVSDGRGFGETRSTCDATGACSDVGARGELWWVDLTTLQAHALDKLNGKGTLPTGPAAHNDDSTLNYEPTVGPIPSGGYAWVIFTSRRLYGNIATINPWWSDPRFHDFSSTPTTKKLWVAAVDLNAAPGSDPSHPAFYLPAQELMAGNSRGYWVADPCQSDGTTCTSGDQCCGGYCVFEGASQVCSPTTQTCSAEFDHCNTAADCCDASALCINNRCTIIQ